MTLGNMRSLAKGIAPDRAKRAEVGGHSGRKFLINKKFLTGPASNLHIPNDSVALCLKQSVTAITIFSAQPISASDAVRSKKSY